MAATDGVPSPTPEELMAFLDGESPADARASIEAHVVACAECRQVISDLGGVNRAVAAWQLENAPATLRPPRMPRASAMSPSRVPGAFSWRPAYLAMALGGVAVTVFLVTSLVGNPMRARRAQPAMTVATSHAPESIVDGPIDGRLADRNGPVDRFEARPGGGGGGRAVTESRVAGKALVMSARPAPAPEQSAAPRQPSVIRTATLRLVASDFNAARAIVESIVAQAGGFLDQITVNGAPGAARTLTGSLRVPATRLSDALTRLRQLGQVTEDTQGSE